MTQENKELLLKDLCGRFPYRTFVQTYRCNTGSFELLMPRLLEVFIRDEGLEIKPYLRSLSSMTKEEENEYRMFIEYSYNDFTSESFPCVYVDKINDYLDWLNSHHFDYRGLISKGLALEAPEGMYK